MNMQALAAIVLVPLMILFAVLVQALFALLFAFPLEWAWNESIALLGGPRITWDIAFALLVTTSILGSYFHPKAPDSNRKA
jgi:hypothetical protein